MALPDPTARPAPRAPHRAMLLVLLLASTLTLMAGAVIAPVVGVIRGELGVSGTGAGLILTAHGLSLALVSPFVGWAIDRFGLRTPLVGGLLLYGVAGGTGLVTESYTALIISRFVFGVGAAAVFVGTTVALLALFQGEQRDRVAGWRSTALSLGGIIWPLIGGALGGLSWHAPFAVYLLGIPVGLLTLLVMPALPAEGRAKGGGVVTLLRRRPGLLVFYAFSFFASFLLYVLAVFLPQRLTEVDVEEPFLIALITTSTSVGGSLIGLVYARMKARLGYVNLLRVATVAWALSFLLIGLNGQWVFLTLAAFVFGLGSGVVVPALAMMIGESAPAAQRGQAMSLSGTANFTGQFVAPLILGPVIGATSIGTGFLVGSALAALVLLALLTFPVPSPKPPEATPDPDKPSPDTAPV
ncbi:MFS transporter [Streptomyces sp. TRM76323]|uniref:MFS transporter n=1 Tax=Streptomyces tamarix TaxID=3078565 RepID=A0ABU3QD07_9ACTN|nr:MFS transporter [Streptomyces tamarix]MDT9680652.1 MFS transporter [Streptomyces tamarix]